MKIAFRDRLDATVLHSCQGNSLVAKPSWLVVTSKSPSLFSVRSETRFTRSRRWKGRASYRISEKVIESTMTDADSNDMSSLTDQQLEASFEAIWFDTSFGTGTDDMNVGTDNSVTSTNSVGATSAAAFPALQQAITSDGMTLPNHYSYSKNSPLSQSTSMASSEGTSTALNSGVVTAQHLSGDRSSSSASATGSIATTGDFAVMPAPNTDVKFAPPAFTGRPQLFGKEVPFSVPLAAAAAAPEMPASAGGTSTVMLLPDGGKRKRDADVSTYAVSEDESERERRRMDRNYREQQRSQQISNQIVVLRSLLENARVECKPDKYSTLATVVDYVKTLQQKSSMLDSEHKKLLQTIKQTTEVMSSQYMSVQASTDGTPTTTQSDAHVVGGTSEAESEVYVQGIDYKSIFRASPFALATTSIDGRFLDCSAGFQKLTKFARDELLPAEKAMGAVPSSADDSSSTTSDISSAIGSSTEETVKNLSLFNVLYHSDMGSVYHAMYDILQQPMNHMEDSEERIDKEESGSDRWSKKIRLCRNKEDDVSPIFSLTKHVISSIFSGLS